MPLNIDIQQILLHLFNLVLLLSILYLLLYKPVHDFMDKRAEEYKERDKCTKDALADAEKLKAAPQPSPTGKRSFPMPMRRLRR